jgi:two-component system cell cycle sensor histidine kinase/response regulator CckA
MAIPLQVLILEDNPSDAELMLHALRAAGYEPTVKIVETEQEFRDQLSAGAEIILSDFNMPNFDGLRALEVLTESKLNIPMIIVSGSIGEERAVQVMLRGATDYIVKDRMGRLGQAVSHALEKRRLRESKNAADRALSESELRFKQLADCMPVIVWSAQPDGNVDYFNQRWTDFTGIPNDVQGDQSWVPVLHPDDVQRSHDKWYAAIASGQPYEQELRFKEQKTGEYRWQLAKAIPIRSKDGDILRWYGTATDIQRQKSAEENDRLLAAIVQSSHDAVFSKTVDGIVLSWNKGAENIFGFSAQEMIGQSVAKLFPADRAGEMLEILEMLKTGDSIRDLTVHKEKKDRTVLTVSLNISPFKDETGKTTSYSVIARDVTEYKRLEDQLRQSQKMDAVGRLAGGVAHDFNNLLTVIIGRAELTERRTDLHETVRRNVGLIHQTADRAANLTRQLLQFSRQQVLQPQVLELNTIVPDMQELLRRLIAEDIDLVIKLNSKVRRMKADKGQIEQVIMNLVVNARDAMPEGGKLTIETANVELDEEYCRTHPDAKPGCHVMLAVGDTGCGMSEHVRAHIFEPFFTTKEQGKGTGLGLSTVYGIVKQAGGNIFVYSEVNQGTVFKVYFPAVKDTAPGSNTSTSLLPVVGGGESILLVEDEDGIRELLKEILVDKGYTVLTARDGVEALQISADYDGLIHLLLTDVVMPKMNGKQVATQLLNKRNEMRVLFMSGYTSETIVNRGVLDEGIEFLEKPFTPNSVARRVRDVLDGLKPRRKSVHDASTLR